MELENNIRTISANSKPYKSFTEPKLNSEKRIYNLDSILDINTNTISTKLQSDNIKKKKKFPRSISVKGFFDHYDKRNCEHCEGIDNLVEEDKSKLSSFIQNNSQFLKLFGNRRYNRSSPYLFVEDHKCGKDDRIGLVPIPSKPRVIMKSPEENTNLYEIQRRIVMIRRYQYGKRNFSEPNKLKNDYIEYIDEDNLLKIILIQKIFRGYTVRVKVYSIMNFKELINRFQELLDKIKAKRILRYLINYEKQIQSSNEKNKRSDYISKIKRNKKNIMEQEENIFQNINDLKKYSKKIVPKERVKNSSSLSTKDYYDLKGTNDKINKIENSYKNHYDSKRNIVKKDETKENKVPKGLFIDKIFYSQMVQKVVNFNNIMRNALQKAVFRKKPKKDELELEEDKNKNKKTNIKHEIPQVNIYLDNQLRNVKPEQENIIDSKIFIFKNKRCYINKTRKRKIKIKEDNIEEKQENIEENKDTQEKLKKIPDNDIIINKVLNLPKEKLCYMTKQHRKYNKILNKDEIKENIPTKGLIINQNERFKYEGELIPKEKGTNYNYLEINLDSKKENETKKIDLLTDNKIEIKYIGDINNIKFKKEEDKSQSLEIGDNSNVNFKNNDKSDKICCFTKNILKDNNFSINYIGNPSKFPDKKEIELKPEKILDFKYEHNKEIPQENSIINQAEFNNQPNEKLKSGKENEENKEEKEKKDESEKKKENENIGEMEEIKENSKKEIDDKIKKDKSFEISNFDINYIKEKESNKKSEELQKETISNINYIGEILDDKEKEKDKENEIKQKSDDDNKISNNDDNIIIIQKDINKINNILKMENKENFSIIDKKPLDEEDIIIETEKTNDIKDKKDNGIAQTKSDDIKKKDLIFEKNIDFNIIQKKEKTEGVKQFNKDEISIIPNNSITYEGIEKKLTNENSIKDSNDKESKLVNENKATDEIYLIPKINRYICYIKKTYMKKDTQKKEVENENEQLIPIIKRTDINNNNQFKNGLLITKLRYINNKNMPKEKIYKKPLFNEFYSFFIEEIPTKEKDNKQNLKSKPKELSINKKNSKENIIPNDDTKKSEKLSQSQKPTLNKNLTEKEEIIKNGLIKRTLPRDDSSEIIKIKPNHLLKVIKVQKGKTTYERYIHVGKVVPKKIKEENEEFIYIRYKSKTPSKTQKKYLQNNLIKNYKDDDDVIKYIPKWKEDIYLKSKPKIEEKEEKEENIKNDISIDDENKMIEKSPKLIKVYKFNYKNYCYASKIRKINIEKKEENISEIEIIKDNDYISKEEIRQNIINNNSYITKDIIKKNIYTEYLNHYKNLNQNIIYKIPISYKDNLNIPNYITKTRHAKFTDLKEQKESQSNDKENKEEIEKELNEKPINKLSLITKKRIKTLILPILDRTKLKIDKCNITKENKKYCLSMPNPKYKSEYYLITKKRKKLISNPEEELELKLPSENNRNGYFTKERKRIINKANGKIPLEDIENIKIPLKGIYYIEKTHKKENLDKIKTIQNIYRTKKNKENKDDNLLFNNEDKNAFIPRKKYLNLKNNEDEDNNQDNYIFGGYISKINKRYVYKLYPPEKCYISKQLKFQIKKNLDDNEPKQKNYSFLSLLDFFIKKNVQEFVFPQLKVNKEINNSKRLETNYRIDTNQNIIEENNSDSFTYPKYYNILRRIYNFYKTQKREDNPEAQKIYDELIPNIKEAKSLNDLIIKLNDNEDDSNKIIDNQNKEPDENADNNDLIEEIGEFVKYDKNLSNSAFIKNKLKENPKMKDNKNLFNIIKIVDDEYNNLINGKYCYKCGKEILKCKCDDINYIFKETENGEGEEKNVEEDEDDNFDFDMDDDEDEGITKTKKINYFEYDTNKKKGLQMINKPRLEDYISQPKKVLQIYNRNQLNEINKNLRNYRLDSKNSNLKLFNNEFNSENNFHQRKTTNSNFINTFTSNNDDNFLGSNNKNMLSSNNFK